MRLKVLVTTWEQSEEALKSKADFLILEPYFLDGQEIEELAVRAHESGRKIGLSFPMIYREKEKKYFEQNREIFTNAKFDAFWLRTPEETDFARQLNKDAELVADYNIHAWNNQSREFLLSSGFSQMTLSPELSFHELRDLKIRNDEMILYGHLPMMITANCLRKTTNRCTKREEGAVLIDRMQNEMNVLTVCRFCENLILNSVPLSLWDSFEKVKELSVSDFRLNFTVESRGQTKRILHCFEELLYEEKAYEKPVERFTRLGFLHKIE